MDETVRPIRGMLIPFSGELAVVPSTVVAEIIPYQDPQPLGAAPSWLLGSVTWRGLDIPLISFEMAVHGVAAQRGMRARIAVLNTLRAEPGLHFWALLIQGIPQQLSLDAATLAPAPDHEAATTGILSHVLVQGEHAIIPDLDYLEGLARQDVCSEPVLPDEAGAEPLQPVD